MKSPPRNIAIDWLNTIWNTDLPAHSKYLACYLRRFMNSQNDMAWPSYSRMMAETGLTQPTITKYLRLLADEGWLHIEKGSQLENTKYTATFPKVIEEGGKRALLGGSKGDLLGVANDVCEGSKGDLHELNNRIKQDKLNNGKPPKSGTVYKFEGSRIRITNEHYERLISEYPNLDIQKELRQLDLELINTKNWWQAMNAKLNYRNKTAIPTNQQPTKRRQEL